MIPRNYLWADGERQRVQERKSKRQSPPEAHIGHWCAFGIEFDLEDRETDYSPRPLVAQVVCEAELRVKKFDVCAPLVFLCVNFPEKIFTKLFLLCFPFENRDMSTHWRTLVDFLSCDCVFFCFFVKFLIVCLVVWWQNEEDRGKPHFEPRSVPRTMLLDSLFGHSRN